MRRRIGERLAKLLGKRVNSADQASTCESQRNTSETGHPIQHGPVIWHYTVGQRYDEIVADGELLPRGSSHPGEGRHAVWFTTSDRWETTADKLLSVYINGELVLARLNTHLTHRLGGGLVRIGVVPEDAPLTWQKYKQLSGVSRDMARGLYRVAIKSGSRPGDWRCSFDAIPRSRWLAVGFWDGTNWSNDPNVRSRQPSYDEGQKWILDGLQCGEVIPIGGVSQARRYGVRVDS
jgi:hypothetical protein